ncbi:MAG: hypothetical protein NVSMB39_7030 [Candidatus Saccharimonadales bacterium]
MKMFRKSEAERLAAIQRQAESVIFWLEQLLPAIEADHINSVKINLNMLTDVMHRVPIRDRKAVAELVSQDPIGKHAVGVAKIYATLNQMLIHNEHDHIHGYDRQPDRA